MNCFTQVSRLKSGILFITKKGQKTQEITLQCNRALSVQLGYIRKAPGEEREREAGISKGAASENLIKLLNILQSKEG